MEENTFTREFAEQPVEEDIDIIVKEEVPSVNPVREEPPSRSHQKLLLLVAVAVIVVILVIVVPVSVKVGNRNSSPSAISNDSPVSAPVASPVATPVAGPTPPPIASSAAPIKSPVTTPVSPIAEDAPTKAPQQSIVEPDGRCCEAGFVGMKGSFPDCTSFYRCLEGGIITPYQTCAAGTVFDETQRACAFPNGPCLADACGQPDTRPTAAPVEPTDPPTRRPTEAPVTAAPTAVPQPTTEPTSTPTFPPGAFPAGERVEATLESVQDRINANLLRSLTPTNTWQPSTVYRYQGMIDGLRYMYQNGVANLKFYMGEDGNENGHIYGLVNVAAFLGQSMQESIQYDVCDENSWDLINGRYPISNSCGQLGQSYQDYKCPAGEEHMACEIDLEMTITATTNAKWYGAPAPLKCGPKSVYPQTGYWNYNCECNRPWANPPQLCTVYEGQKAGCEMNDEPVANGNGRTDVEGCCWWGRGVIQTTGKFEAFQYVRNVRHLQSRELMLHETPGPCNFGKLNYYLGKRAADENRPSRYPNYDFCKNPQLICSSKEHPELKWIAGMFYWMVSVQEHQEDGFDYITALKNFVDTGMSSDAFIDSVSGIVNRGCAFPPCATGDVDKKLERRDAFRSALREFGVLSS